MKVVVEIIPPQGSPFDLDLDFDSIGSFGLPEGTWSSLPGKTRHADGPFFINDGDLHLRSGKHGYIDAIKIGLGFRVDRVESAGFLRSFGQWFDIFNGKIGFGSITTPGSWNLSIEWRIKSGAPRAHA